MSVLSIEIIPANTAQVTSLEFSSSGERTVCASTPLLDGEGVKIQFTHNGSAWQDLYLNGVLQEVLPKHSMITILGPGKFRCIKSVTATAISVVTWKLES